MDGNAVKLWIGSYQADGKEPGSGEGIWQVSLNRATGALGDERLAITTPVPSFLARHPSAPVLYAVSEVEQGSVNAFAAVDGTLNHLRTAATGGSFPCHLRAFDGALWVANYGDGVVTRLQLDDDGNPVGDPETYPNAGSGADPERQEGPHAHFVHDAGGGSVWVSDLGTDELRRFTESGADGVAAVLPPGTGPRHMATLPGGAVVVVGELDSRLHVLAPNGSGTLLNSLPALSATVPEGEPSQPSHLDVGASAATGNFLYTVTRGPDVLSVFTADGGSSLTHVAEMPVGGRWPRHFGVVPTKDDSADLVVVANQYSSSLDVLRVDGAGRIEQVASLALPVPSCVLAAD